MRRLFCTANGSSTRRLLGRKSSTCRQTFRHFSVTPQQDKEEVRTSLVESTLQSLEEDAEFQITAQNLKKLGQVLRCHILFLNVVVVVVVVVVVGILIVK
jgi:hypothetical protein